MNAELLPNGWQIKSLSELSTAIQYGHTAKANQGAIGPRMLRITDIQDGAVNWGGVPYCAIDKKIKSKYLLQENDLVFARTGATVGKSYLIRGTIPESVYASYLIRVRLAESVDPKYVAYFFQSSDYWAQISESQAGIGQPNVNGKKLAAIRVPVAPLDQQKRIVAEIEKQFSRLDEAVANLKRVKANLKRYKAAVLKAAVEGKLTEEWRKAHPDVEPASKLLDRILAERRAKWEEAELAKMEAKGKAPKNDKWKAKYKAPGKAVEAKPERLPNGWMWASVEQLNPAERPCAYGVLQPGPDVRDGIPLIRVGDIQEGAVLLDEMKKVSPEIAAKYPRTTLQGGEVLISLVGAIGRTAVVPGALTGANTARAVGVMPLTQHVMPEWVESWFRNPAKITEMTGKAHEVARKTLNLEDVRAAGVAIPPLLEQEEIVGKVAGLLSVMANVEAEVARITVRSNHLRQSVVAKAFSGSVVK